MQYLYLIKCQQFFKIGIANDVEERLSALQTGSPYPLAILDRYEFADAGLVERVLHKRFADARVQGEWFSLSSDDIEQLAKICQSFDGTRPVKKPRLPTTRTVFVLDLSSLPTEQVLAEEDIEVLPEFRVERRGDRSPTGFAVYKRGKPVYVGYISGDTENS